jgi:hypothetical protein
VEAVVRAVPEVKQLSDVELAVLSQIALNVATDAIAKNKTAEQIREATETAIQNEVKTATKAQVKAMTKAAIKTATSTATATKTATRIKTKLGFRILLPPIGDKPESGKAGKRPRYPDGSVVWLMGELKRGQEWKAILPPYTQNKPISTTLRPIGVKARTGTPQETLTFIGGKLPFKNVAFDLGITDGYIDVKNKRIEFAGGGLKTDVGKRIPSPTTGITLANTRSFTKRLPGRLPKRDGQRSRHSAKPASRTVSIG